MENISLEKVNGAIMVIAIDCQGEKVNKISSKLLAEMDEALALLKEDKEIKGVVILSAKEDNFVVGADIDELNAMHTAAAVRAYISKGHAILNAIEKLNIPVIACIHGACLGGGLEIALACHYRLAVDTPGTLLGLPEVQLGLLPAGGGTQRLPRLIGIQNALAMMLTAKSLRARQAFKAGLIDELIPAYGGKDIAVNRCWRLAKAGVIKNNGYSLRKRKKKLTESLLETNAIGRKIIFSQARKALERKTYGCYQAPYAIIDAVEVGLKHGRDAGFQKEISLLENLVISPQSKALMSLFFGMKDLKKTRLAALAKSAKNLAIIGMGFMGQGIAAISTAVCDTILMKDVSLEAAAKGMKSVWREMEKRVKSGAISPIDQKMLYGKLVACEDFSMLAHSDIAVEAVFEDLELKKKLLAEFEAIAKPEAIFASNTSAIPISDIAAGCRHPENVIGMHYFSPVPQMPLLEIIVTEQTADWVTASALNLGITQGKTCIVVKDGPGFYTTRILAPLLNETFLLLAEGASPLAIDSAMRRFGFPVGPATLIDEVGIDVAAHVFGGLAPLFVQRGMPTSNAASLLFAQGYLGRKSGKGIYRYDAPNQKGKKQVNAALSAIINAAPQQDFPAELIQQRISLMMVSEALLCLEEGVIACPRDGDIGAVLGLGFPPFTGGPFSYVDGVGAKIIRQNLEALSEKYGERFRAAQILVDAEKNNKKFRA